MWEAACHKCLPHGTDGREGEERRGGGEPWGDSFKRGLELELRNLWGADSSKRCYEVEVPLICNTELDLSV